MSSRILYVDPALDSGERETAKKMGCMCRWRPEVSALLLTTLFFETGSLTKPGAQFSSYIA